MTWIQWRAWMVILAALFLNGCLLLPPSTSNCGRALGDPCCNGGVCNVGACNSTTGLCEASTTCGGLNQTCCANGTCSSTLLCDATTQRCLTASPTCGTLGQACCTTGTACTQGVCGANNVCQNMVPMCGGLGMQCCAGSTCSQGLVCGANNVCAQNQPTCGGSGQTCCAGSTCNAGLVCGAQNTCGTAQNCGGFNQACCSGNTCSGGFTCLSGICANIPNCGGQGQICCAGAQCNSGLVCGTNGQCSAAPQCGGQNQPCCAGLTCNSGFACNFTGTCVPMTTGLPIYSSCNRSFDQCNSGTFCTPSNVTFDPNGQSGDFCTTGCTTSAQCPADPVRGTAGACVVSNNVGQCYSLCGAGNTCSPGFTCGDLNGTNICIPDGPIVTNCGGFGEACCPGSICTEAGTACGTDGICNLAPYSGCAGASVGASCLAGYNSSGSVIPTSCQRPMVSNPGPNGFCTALCNASGSECPLSPIAGRNYNCYLLQGSTAGQCYVDCDTGQACPANTICSMVVTATGPSVRLCTPPPN